MKKIINKSTISLSAIIIAAFVVLTACAVFAIVNRVGATDGSPSGGHLVTIHDNGKETVVLSQSGTIGDALKEAGVMVDKSDSVEPSVAEKLVASEYQVNIYRARPVIVIDGTIRQKVITPYQTASQIASSADITLYDEDTTTISRTDDIVSDGAGLRLIIDRATPFTFILYGKEMTARTQSETVGGMLAEKGISLGQNDKLSLDKNTAITSGMSVRLWREGKQTLTADETIDFETEKIQDGDQDIGYRAIKTPGKNGKRTVTYEVIVQDGKEVSRTKIASLTTEESSKQVEIVGAKYKGAYTTSSENENITWKFLLTNGFSREQAAGIMGNIMQEHGFNTTGDGLAQWIGGRKAVLLSRPDPYNIYTQLDFMMYELNTGYQSARNAIKASSSVNEAVIAFQNRYEGCGVCMESRRLQFAFNILASH